jgi:hypothetical protein
MRELIYLGSLTHHIRVNSSPFEEIRVFLTETGDSGLNALNTFRSMQLPQVKLFNPLKPNGNYMYQPP